MFLLTTCSRSKLLHFFLSLTDQLFQELLRFFLSLTNYSFLEQVIILQIKEALSECSRNKYLRFFMVSLTACSRNKSFRFFHGRTNCLFQEQVITLQLKGVSGPPYIFSTLPCPTLLYLSLPYPTIPYPTLQPYEAGKGPHNPNIQEMSPRASK